MKQPVTPQMPTSNDDEEQKNKNISLKSLNDQSKDDQKDDRDSIFKTESEQTLEKPARSVLGSPIEDNGGDEERRNEAVKKNNSIKPLL